MDLLPYIHQKLVFTPEDIAAQVGSVRSAATVIARYIQQGYVSKVRRGLYCANNIATKLPEANKYQIGSSITPSAFIAYHAAMEYHGLAHQVYYDVVVGTAQQFVPFEFDSCRFTQYRTQQMIGIERPLADSHVRVTSLERTIVDCIDRMDLSGGWEEVVHCLQAVQYIREEELKAVLKAYDTAALYKKVGYLFETLHVPVSEELVAACKAYAKGSVTRLTSDGDSDTFCQAWRMYVPGRRVES